LNPNAEVALHLVVGLIVGGLIGFFVVLRIRADQGAVNGIGLVVAGFALVMGGVASQYGDRLWLHSASSIISTEAPKQNRLSWIASGLIGSVGICVILFSLARNLSFF
jgi:hypothetical protein